ncbi:chymotrypsin-1-like [Diabrotica virgifera virgifera]|uniref:Chymotrypsin-1-like n=1 Tax=Diabrotica virgifera virgifera TaxID=50390 RepID=A0A6P7G8R0_DIAVI|nr:chymotrypsin-1-like [Diabrotica virgifera virgifera]
MTPAIVCDILVIMCFVHSVLATNNINNNLQQIDFGLEEEQDFPYQVSVHLNYNNQFVCGAVVIAEDQVLTLAHCLYYDWGGLLPPIIISVNSGGKMLNTEEYESFSVSDIRFHKEFNTSEMKYDLAVLDIPVKLMSKNSPIIPIGLQSDSMPSRYDNCIAIGWNNVSANQEVIDVILTDCNIETSTKMCAKHKAQNETLCNMVPGSLLVCSSTLVGIMSVVPECDSTNQISLFESARHAKDLLISSAASVAVGFPSILIWIYSILTILINTFIR